VKRGVEGGFTQACHGKKGPLQKMKEGDGIIFYSSKQKMEGKSICQNFTAMGTIKDSEVFQHQMTPNFVPWRRRVNFEKTREIPIKDLIPKLKFIKNKEKWGGVFRYGFLQIPEEDFLLVSSQMLEKFEHIKK